jgi:hypothetical protein
MAGAVVGVAGGAAAGSRSYIVDFLRREPLSNKSQNEVDEPVRGGVVLYRAGPAVAGLILDRMNEWP